jgi:hypothetical protein
MRGKTKAEQVERWRLALNLKHGRFADLSGVGRSTLKRALDPRRATDLEDETYEKFRRVYEAEAARQTAAVSMDGNGVPDPPSIDTELLRAALLAAQAMAGNQIDPALLSAIAAETYDMLDRMRRQGLPISGDDLLAAARGIADKLVERYRQGEFENPKPDEDR